MKRILMAAAVALCFAGNSFAQADEKTGEGMASESAFNNISTEDTAVAVGGVLIVALGVMANSNGYAAVAPPGPDKDPICGAGEELVDGECVPVDTTTTVTTTNTVTNTVTLTTPVTVTVSATSTL